MISEELSESKSLYINKKCQFNVSISLQKHDSQSSLIVELRNEQKMQCFQLRMNREEINDDSEMRFCFQTPEDLYHTIIELFDQIRISEDGVISFEMKLNASKLKKKIFRLKTNRKNIQQMDLVRMRFENISKELRIQLARKDERIQSLNRQHEQCMEILLHLKADISQMQKEQAQLSLENKKKEFQMNSVVKENQLQRQQLTVLRKKLQEFNIRFGIQQFYNYFDNPHWHHFSVYKSSNSLRVIKKGNDNVWNSFIRNAPLAQGKIYQFTIKQVKTNYRNIMIGMGTKQSFGIENAYKTNHCISYNSYTGNLWANGLSTKAGKAIFDGETIIFQINWILCLASWWSEGKKMFEMSIECFRNKQSYLFLQFYNSDDEMQIMLY